MEGCVWYQWWWGYWWRWWEEEGVWVVDDWGFAGATWVWDWEWWWLEWEGGSWVWWSGRWWKLRVVWWRGRSYPDVWMAWWVGPLCFIAICGGA